MVNFQTVKVDGLVIRSAWDPYHAGPVELHITLDHRATSDGRGITERKLRHLSLVSIAPESPEPTEGLRVVGDWLDEHKPRLRARVADPELFFAHVALFFVLAIRDGMKGVYRVLANYAGIRPSMARTWVEKARRLGMLASNGIKLATVGRAFGILTDKARQVLASQSFIEGVAA
jgi:hypothetical protein